MGQRIRIALFVMRLADMERVHPDQIEDKCGLCGEVVGIYPSGQRVILQQGRKYVDLVCHVCAPATQSPDVLMLAPGATRERSESKPRDP